MNNTPGPVTMWATAVLVGLVGAIALSLAGVYQPLAIAAGIALMLVARIGIGYAFRTYGSNTDDDDVDRDD